MIFLMSSERSGSNMLRAIMSRHSAVSAPTPAHLVKSIMPLLPAYGDLGTEANFRRLAGHVVDIIASQLGNWDARLEASDIVARIPDRSFASLLRHVYAAEAEVHGNTMSFVKDNGNILWATHLRSMFEDARFIYLVRDPRDYVLSWLKSPSHAGGQREATRIWQTEQSSALAACAIASDSMPVLPVRYEELVSDPAGELDRICKFVGISREAAMTEDFTSRAHREEADKIANWENVAGEIKQTNFGKFRDGMSPGRVRWVERRLAFEMNILGYEPTRPTAVREPLTIQAGKLYRAFLGSIRLLFGGRRRRQELGTRIKRLKSLRNVQADVRRSPRRLVGSAGSESER